MCSSRIAMVKQIHFLHSAPCPPSCLPSRGREAGGILPEEMTVCGNDFPQFGGRALFIPLRGLVMPEDVVVAVRAYFKPPVAPLAKECAKRDADRPRWQARSRKHR